MEKKNPPDLAKTDRAAKSIETYWALFFGEGGLGHTATKLVWPLVGATLFGALAPFSSWISGFGPIGWAAAACVGAILAIAIAYGIETYRLRKDQRIAARAAISLAEPMPDPAMSATQAGEIIEWFRWFRNEYGKKAPLIEDALLALPDRTSLAAQAVTKEPLDRLQQDVTMIKDASFPYLEERLVQKIVDAVWKASEHNQEFLGNVYRTDFDNIKHLAEYIISEVVKRQSEPSSELGNSQ